MVLAIILVAGCVLVPQDDIKVLNSAELSPESIEPAETELPNVNLDGDLLYQLLLGEIATHRGELNTAAKSLVSAAEKTEDPRVAERATQVALSAEQFEMAKSAAKLWARLETTSDQPKEALAIILAEKGDIDAAANAMIEVAEVCIEGRYPGQERISLLEGIEQAQTVRIYCSHHLYSLRL